MSRHAALRLHFNENTAGCSPAVLDAIRSIEREDTALYPDYSEVTAAVARYFGVDPDWVQLTNGLDEGLHAAAFSRHAPGASVLILDPAFEMYEACSAAASMRAVHIAPEPDFRFPLEAVLAAATPQVRLAYLTDPNNPTGLPIPAGAIETIAATARDALILIDEAYAEFSGRTVIGPALDRHRNLVAGRTFAKAHGLAALRIGALVAHPDTLAPLRGVLPPYSLNICAVRALEAALDDPAYLDWYVGQSLESRRQIYRFCERFGLYAWPSEANFVLIRIGDAAAGIVAALAERGILVRDKSQAPGCEGCVRITAGVVDHTRRCLDALDEILSAEMTDDSAEAQS